VLTTYKIIEAPDDAKTGIVFRGGAIKLWQSKAHETVIHGPAETGKTFAALHKLDTLMWKYPGAQSVIMRKTYKSAVASVIQTFEDKVISKDAGIITYGGERPEWYDYPNGSRVWVAGMDNADKVLSSERDFIYTNQT
jgi:phage terminase large subunit